MSDGFVAFVYLFGIAFGLCLGWYIWRKPNLVYKNKTIPLDDIVANATMKALFTKAELNSNVFMKLEIIMQHAKVEKDPFEFMSRHINAMKDTEYSNKIVINKFVELLRENNYE